MGKTTRWFRALLGYKKSSPPESSSPASSNRSEKKEKKPKWGLSKPNPKNSHDSATKGSTRYNTTNNASAAAAASGDDLEGLDANKHAIAVAAATAAVAEAALAAAHAAAEVVRLTSGSRSGDRRREVAAAVKIQSAFRAYLARRALRALKGLVKLQALVRGRIVRKQSADMLRRMQAMARIQARACATRGAHSWESSHSSIKSSQFHHAVNTTPRRHDLQQQQNPKQMQRSGSRSNSIGQNGGERTYPTTNWLDRWMEECTWSDQREASFEQGVGDDDKTDKILEIDTWNPRQSGKRRTFTSSQYFSAWNDNRRGGGVTNFKAAARNSTKYQNPDPSLSSGDVSSLRSVKFPPEVAADQAGSWHVESSPRVHSAASRPGSSGHRRGGTFSPARSFFGDYISFPSYMANTESSRAKFRSQSAPKQRAHAGRRFSHGIWDANSCSERDSTVPVSYQSHGYPGSARSEKQGTPNREHPPGGFRR